MDEKGYHDEYIISRDFLEKHKKEHYDLKDDEVIFYSDSYVTLEDIYNDAEPITRCNECKYRCTDSCPMYVENEIWSEDDGYNYWYKDKTVDDFYCAYGKKIDEEE